LFQRITEGLTAVPGAQQVTSSSEPLLAESMDNDCYRPQGRPEGTPAQDGAWTNWVGGNFFETFGIPILSGRALTLRDNQTAPAVAVINETLAKAFFPNKNAVGQTIATCGANATLIQVVGVSKDAKYSEIRGNVPPTMYLPYAQGDDLNGMTFEVKTAASVASMAPKFRDVVKAVDKDLPVLEVRTQTEQIEATLAQERVFASLTSGFGMLALVLASIGIYGVMAYTVSRRTNEIGIRMALGAEARGVLGMVLGETAWLACVGIVVGLAGAWAATRVVESMLFGVKARDAVTFAGGAGLLLLVALVAALIPAWRAARVDPMNALRHE
jgi:predicted permease